MSLFFFFFFLLNKPIVLYSSYFVLMILCFLGVLHVRKQHPSPTDVGIMHGYSGKQKLQYKARGNDTIWLALFFFFFNGFGWLFKNANTSFFIVKSILLFFFYFFFFFYEPKRGRGNYCDSSPECDNRDTPVRKCWIES